MKHPRTSTVSIVAVASLTLAATAATYTIDADPSGTSDYNGPNALADVLAVLQDNGFGDTIQAAPGTYTSSITLWDPNNLTIESTGGAAVTTIDAEGGNPVISGSSLHSGIMIDGFTLTGGETYGNSGGGVNITNSNVTISNCIITGNSAYEIGGGAGIHVHGGHPVFSNCSITGNTNATKGVGAYIMNGANMQFSNCTFSNNSFASGVSERKAAGVLIVGNSYVTFDTCEFDSLEADLGAAVYVEEGAATMINCMVSNNSVTSEGGAAIEADPGHGYASVQGCTLCGNTPRSMWGDIDPDLNTCVAFSCDDTSPADGVPDECVQLGDGVHTVPGDYATIQEAIESVGNGDWITLDTGSYILGGTSDWLINPKGKPLRVSGTGDLDNTILDGNHNKTVIVMDSCETYRTIIAGVTIQNGNSTWSGGGMRCEFASPSIISCVFTDNTGYEGGAVRTTWSDVYFNNVDFTNNSTTFGHGGAIHFHYGAPEILHSNIDNNESGFTGGGIYADHLENLYIYNCTITNNSAMIFEGEVLGDSGGIHGQDSDIVITASDISGNIGYLGGGLGLYDCQTYIGDTTINDNLSHPEFGYGSGFKVEGGQLYLSDFVHVQNNIGANDSIHINSVTPDISDTVVCGADNLWELIGGTGTYTDDGGNCIVLSCEDRNWDNMPDECQCPDLDMSGTVDTGDIATLVGDWGICELCDSDFNGSGTVDVSDLLYLLLSWGRSC